MIGWLSARLFGIGLFLTLLGACTHEAPPDPVMAQQGRWVGFFESSFGLLGCPTRGSMTVAVSKGAVTGNAQGDGFVMTVSGTLGPNGAIVDGVMRRDTRAAAIVTGTFLDNDAAGRWQGASCEGVWSLRKVAQ